MSGAYIYILGSHTGTLYIGVTSNLYLRVMQHKEGTWEGFTTDYGCKRLLYFEGYEESQSHRAGKTTQRLAARKEAQPHSHHQSRVQRPCTDLGMEDDYSA
jgi:predicted GIY-YIG superfamily endonuclease